RAVHVEDSLRLVGQVEQARDAGLHAEGQLVLLNTRDDLGVIADAALQLVKLLHHTDNVALPLAIDPLGPADVQDRIALGSKLDPLELSGQKAAMPLP